MGSKLAGYGRLSQVWVYRQGGGQAFSKTRMCIYPLYNFSKDPGNAQLSNTNE